MDPIITQLSQIGVIPVIAIEDAKHAVPLANALEAGGIPAAEVTFRTAAAEDAIRAMAENCPNVIVGAGTILNVEQCKRAIDAGAKFIVSPGFSQEVVDFCQSQNVPILPGCVNPSDMTRAVNSGLEVVKFFPAGVSGGLDYIKNVAPVFPALKFMPTGGVNPSNLNTYLSYNRIVGCGGSWMVKSDMIAAERFDEITQMCREAISAMLDFQLAHVGFNTASNEEAGQVTQTLGNLFGFAPKEGNSSWFAGKFVEAMKAPYLGTHGHLAISTRYLSRAIAYMEHMGVKFNAETAKYDAKGEMTAIYLQDEVGGFAIHLVQAK